MPQPNCVARKCHNETTETMFLTSGNLEDLVLKVIHPKCAAYELSSALGDLERKTQRTRGDVLSARAEMHQQTFIGQLTVLIEETSEQLDLGRICGHFDAVSPPPSTPIELVQLIHGL